MQPNIHAIWLGNKLTPLALACLDDWSKQGYNYKLWTERDEIILKWINSCEFARECYRRKLYAFVTDYLRLKILQKEGGLYLDTDVTIRKNPFDIFENIDFCVGYEDNDFFGTAVIFSKSNSEILSAAISFYENEIMQSNLFIGPQVLTYLINNKKHSDKLLKAPKEYFYSYDANGKIPELQNINYLVHWFQHSWKNPKGMYFLKSKNKGIFGKAYEWQKYFFKSFKGS